MTKLILSLVSSILMCYVSTTAQNNLNLEFQITSSKTSVVKGEEFIVNVKVKNFKDILGLQAAINWKLDDYEFRAANVQNLDFTLSTNLINEHDLLFNYIYNIKEANLADNLSIIEIKLRAKKNTLVEGICFNPDALAYEVVKGTPFTPSVVIDNAIFRGLDAACADFSWGFNAKGEKSIKLLKGALGSNDLINTNIKTYPNPSNDYVFFDLTALQNVDNVDISLFDLQGKEITKLTFKANHLIKLDIQNLVSGTYLYKIITEKGVGSGKLVKI
jgi:hypothetical protein